MYYFYVKLIEYFKKMRTLENINYTDCRSATFIIINYCYYQIICIFVVYDGTKYGTKDDVITSEALTTTLRKNY